jgi:NAD(P)-dependent dehydrogenase (short-subunit alcohol dehydrogenase family)
MSDWLGLSGRVCVVTGAAGGIGAAISKALVEAGARVALVDLTADRCGDLHRELEALGGPVACFGADISNEEDVDKLARATHDQLGPCEVLVNVPAISGRPDGLLDLSREKWQRQMGVNLGGYLFCSQRYAAQMKALGRGSLIHIGSIAGDFPQPQSGAYSIAKAGVAMMSRVLALELGPLGVRSNVVSPGMVRTPLSERFYSDPNLLKRRSDFVPVGSVGTPGQIANAALFLASDRSEYVTGQNIHVDGGVGLRLMDLFPRPQ